MFYVSAILLHYTHGDNVENQNSYNLSSSRLRMTAA